MRRNWVLMIVVVAIIAASRTLEHILPPVEYAMSLAVAWIVFMVFLMALLGDTSCEPAPSGEGLNVSPA